MKAILFTVKQLADYFQVSEKTIRNWKLKGMPYKQVNQILRFDIEEVNEWIEKQRDE